MERIKHFQLLQFLLNPYQMKNILVQNSKLSYVDNK